MSLDWKYLRDDGVLKCSSTVYHASENSLTELTHGTACFRKVNFGFFVEF